MKLRNLFAVAMASAVLFSCTEKVIIQGPEEEEGVAHIRVGLFSNELGARSAGHYETDASVDELKIYNYALFIFKSSGILEASLIARHYTQQNPTYAIYDSTNGLTFTDGDNQGGNVVINNGIITLSAGTKQFFAIVNAPEDLLDAQAEYLDAEGGLNTTSAKTITLSFEDLKKIVGEYDSRTYGDLPNSPKETGLVYFENSTAVFGDTPNRGFMMTTVSANGYVETLIQESTDDNDIKDIHLTVGRAMAKVSLASTLSGTAGSDPGDQPNGTLDVYSYKIINNPKQMYVIPRSESGVWTAPFFNYGIDQYDPDNYFVSHNTVHDPGNTYDLDENYMPVSVEGARTFTYCIENSNITPREGTATQAIIKGKFTPGGDATIYASPDDKTPLGSINNPDGTFYRVFIEKYDHNGITGGNRYHPVYYNDDPTPHLDILKTELAVNGWVASEISLDVRKYEEGICFYRLPLYNSDYDASPYTVKRNSYYMINIVEVRDAGNVDEEGDVDPTDPLEPQTHIRVDIKVSKWDKVEQPGILG